MRYTALAAAMVVAIGAPSVAAAQHSAGTGSPMSDLLALDQFITRGIWNQWAATRPAALAGLPRPSRTVIKNLVQCQAEVPLSVVDLAVTVDTLMGEDIRRMAKSERADPEDISGAVLLKVLVDTRNALAREAKRNPVVAPGERPWEERIAEAELNVREAIAMQSETALAMARD